MSLLRPDARERRTVLIALAVGLAAVTIARGGVPFARRWAARSEAISIESDRLARLRGLVAAREQLEERVREQSLVLESMPQRLLAGRTAALAASSLQSLLQEYADRSRLAVSRLDVAGAPDVAGTRPLIPATLSAIGDIHGLTDILSLILHGPFLLEVTELSVRPNPALRGELLQMTVTLRAGWTGG